jgi:hypothetical protein
MVCRLSLATLCAACRTDLITPGMKYSCYIVTNYYLRCISITYSFGKSYIMHSELREKPQTINNKPQTIYNAFIK